MEIKKNKTNSLLMNFINFRGPPTGREHASSSSCDWYQSEDSQSCQIVFYVRNCQIKAVKPCQNSQSCQVVFYRRNCQDYQVAFYGNCQGFSGENCQELSYVKKSQNFASLKNCQISLLKIVVVEFLHLQDLVKVIFKVVVVEIYLNKMLTLKLKVPSDKNTCKTFKTFKNYLTNGAVIGDQYTHISGVVVVVEEGVGFEVVVEGEELDWVLDEDLESSLEVAESYFDGKPGHVFSSPELYPQDCCKHCCKCLQNDIVACGATMTNCHTVLTWSSLHTKLSSCQLQKASSFRINLGHYWQGWQHGK